jgi:hypothetical protein
MPPSTKNSTKSKSTPKRASQRTKVAVTTKVAPTETGLGVSDLRLRLVGLEETNEKLLKHISRKRKEIDKFTSTIQEIQQKMMADVSPIMMKMQETDGDIHRIFQKIFATRKMGKQTVRMVKEVYMWLQVSNTITFNPDSLLDEEEQEAFNPFTNGDTDDDEPEDFRGFGKRQPEEGHARQNDRAETRQLRQTFLRLATVFHPDKVDEDQREEFAEIMKEVNLAYQRGDLARLLAIEKQHELGVSIDRSNADDLTLRCQELEHENQLLQEQKIALNDELRQMKGSTAGLGLGDYNQLKKMGIQPIDTIVQQAQDELADVINLRDFVQSFLDKKITVAEFRRGPQRDEDEYFEEEDFDDFLISIFR